MAQITTINGLVFKKKEIHLIHEHQDILNKYSVQQQKSCVITANRPWENL